MKLFSKYFIVFLFLGACADDEFRPADIGLDYFPLQTGVYQLYNITETTYSEINGTQNFKYQLMVTVVDSFPAPEGGHTFVLRRRKRADATASWQDLDTWSARGNDREMIVSEGNIAYVKFILPVKKGNAWNGNAYNSLTEDKYTTTSLDEPFTAGGIAFERSMRIEQENNEDLIVFQDKREEIYARGVGLVYREVIQLSYCTADACLGQQKIESGKIYKQEIVEHGRL